ncbi:uncharacterized protein [Prorops nasuta]|uniref:uncharacterized protein isoform X2 n=1 Tax=Prorops nasuta TaxID=863751 RepID=UPI0034CDA9E3
MAWQGNSYPALLVGATLMILARGSTATDRNAAKEDAGFETVHTSNAAILNRLGLAPLQIPDGHHKKRLAGPEPPGFNAQSRIQQSYSRRHGNRDSHVYIVKLPASPPYYTITKPHKTMKDEKPAKTANSNLPVGFHGNGKPAKVYHWNLPLVKKITEKKKIQAKERMEETRKYHQQQQEAQHRFDIEHKSSDADVKRIAQDYRDIKKHYHSASGNRLGLRQKNSNGKPHTRNNDKRLNYHDGLMEKKQSAYGDNSLSIRKTYRLEDSGVHRLQLNNELHGSRNTVQKLKKHRKKAAMSYYAPIAAKQGTGSIHKNFPGNGKPKAFYVMEKSRKPVYYHPLLP